MGKDIGKKKVTIANPEALTRLRAIEHYQAGHSQRETAAKFGVHFTTIGEWVKMYAEGGGGSAEGSAETAPGSYLGRRRITRHGWPRRRKVRAQDSGAARPEPIQEIK